MLFQDLFGIPRSLCKEHQVLWRAENVETVGLHLIHHALFPAVIFYSRTWAQS